MSSLFWCRLVFAYSHRILQLEEKADRHTTETGDYDCATTILYFWTMESLPATSARYFAAGELSKSPFLPTAKS